MRRDRAEVDLKAGPDDRGRFTVLIGGYSEQWSIDTIKTEVGRGLDLREKAA